MDYTVTEFEEQIILHTLPEIVWENVFQRLAFALPTLESCSKASDVFDNLIKRSGQFYIFTRNKDASTSFRERIGCVPKCLEDSVFPEPIPANSQITVMNICLNPNLQPTNDYLEWLIASQRDSLEKLHISCLGIKKPPVCIELPEMKKLRNLEVERNVTWNPGIDFQRSLRFPRPILLPALETLTLSAFGLGETWNDLLRQADVNNDSKSSWTTVKHLRILPSPPKFVTYTSFYLADKLRFPNLVSLEIPAIRWKRFGSLWNASRKLKRLTLTLPTRANPNVDPEQIRKEVGEENESHLDDFAEWEQNLITFDNKLRREGKRFPNLTNLHGLEELCIKTDAGDWSPTLVSCPDLLSLPSLKSLSFCGHKPKYLPDIMMEKMKKQFTVVVDAPNNMPIKSKMQKNLEYLSDEVLSIVQPYNFRNWIYCHPEGPLLPRITTLNICIDSNFQPMDYYLNSLLESQRDSLQLLHISCLITIKNSLHINLQQMKKLRNLKVERTVTWDKVTGSRKSVNFSEPAFLPALETLTLSAFGEFERWDDFPLKPNNRDEPRFLTCESLKHLRILPALPKHVHEMIVHLSQKFAFPNLVSLEIPAVFLNTGMCDMLPVPENLMRLTLTLPTEGLHKHLFDVCITGYGEQVCTAIWANPERNRFDIREEIEAENEGHLDNVECVWERHRIKWENHLRCQGRRFPCIIHFSGLEELHIVSDTRDWGPTLVSCEDLLSMESLKTLQFCGHKRIYIPDEMIDQMKERFTVLSG